MNSWTYVTSHPRPAISGPTTQIVTESENKNPSSTEYWMIIVWAYKPSLRKTNAYWSQRVVCIQNILEPFFQKNLLCLGRGWYPVHFWQCKDCYSGVFSDCVVTSGRSPRKLTRSETVWVCRRILFMFELWSKPRTLEIFESLVFSFLN